MGRKHTDAQVSKRHDAVADVLRTGTFGRRKARELADRWGVTPRQIWMDRDRVLKRWADGLDREDRRTRCARLLEESRALRAATATRALARSDGSLMRCAVELMKLERDLLGLAQPAELVVRVEDADPAQLARDVLDVLPVVAGLLPDPQRDVLEAAFHALPAPDTTED